ncbi:MAG: ParB/RepB/Spo0J family partition protein, partial [Candidatus Bathyarchaeota archaeon]|nr:ParB/RepB/Spo0J family partition protein [Candidatus Bathyarchaeota archaeon]
MSLCINPLYKKILPQMSIEDFEELKISIKNEGQHYPIIANEDLEILDGHHRFRACIEIGIDPDFEVRKFEDKLIEKKFVIESNLRRRHLTSFQLVELGVPLLEIEKLLAKKRQVIGGKKGRNKQLGLVSSGTISNNNPNKVGKAAAIVAKKIGLSTRTFERGKKIIEKATEEDKQKLREGKKSISGVYREITSPRLKDGDINLVLEKKIIKNPFSKQNVTDLLNLLEKLNDSELFCPLCGYKMFEC